MTNNMTMSRTINIADLKARLSEFVELAESGEEVLVCRRNLPVARLVPLATVDDAPPKKLSAIRGWMEDGDPFSRQLDERRAAAASLRRGDPFPE
jgi:prevent-host-death family protein